MFEGCWSRSPLGPPRHPGPWLAAWPLIVCLGSGGALLAGSSPPTSRLVHEQWTVEDGLPVNSVNRVVQGLGGYLWLATNDGLVRFDGVRFTVFDTIRVPALGSTRIVDLLVGRDALWILTEHGGLVRHADGEFTAVAPEGPGAVRVLTLYEDPQGSLWAGTSSHGVYRYQDRRLAPVPGADELSRRPVHSLYRDRRGRLWIGTTDQVARLEGRRLFWVGADGEGDLGVVWGFAEDRAGVLWVATDGGVLRYLDGALSRLAAVRDGVQALGIGPRGALWLDGERGLYRYRDGEVDQLAAWDHAHGLRRQVVTAGDGATAWTISGRSVFRDGQEVFRLEDPRGGFNSLALDHEGTVWLGSTTRGLYALKPARVEVLAEAQGLVHRNVYPIHQDRSGDVWVGALTGNVYRVSHGEVAAFDFAEGARTIYQDRAGNLWLGTWHGLYRFREGRFAPLAGAFGPGEPRGEVLAILEHSDGRLLVGTSQGLYEHPGGASAQGAGWVHRAGVLGAPEPIVRVILEARDGALWLGTNGHGVIHYRDGRFTAVTTREGLASDLVRAIHQDRDGLLWIGTEDRGLSRLDPATLGRPGGPEIALVDKRHGLADNGIHQILEDDRGWLWMSSNRGLFRVRRGEINALIAGETDLLDVGSYSERDGLPNREANGGVQGAGIRTRDGRLWFPTQGGVVILDPETAVRDLPVPPVHIEGVRAGGLEIAPAHGVVTLEPEARTFSVEYTALSFRAPERLLFRTFLEGYDDRWQDAGPERARTYTKVPPGRYTFRVRARSSDGVWNEAGASLRLVVRPFFYETWWFRGALGVALVALVAAAVQARERRQAARRRELEGLVERRTGELVREKETVARQAAELSRQAEELRELDRAKSQLFANVSHEFRTPLTLILGPVRDLRAGVWGTVEPRVAGQLETVERNAARLLELIDQLLDVARLEAGRLDLRVRLADLDAFVGAVVERFLPLAERRQVHLAFVPAQDPVAVFLDHQQLDKVFANLLANALKHTPEGGLVEVRVVGPADGEERAAVEVRDDGPGIPADQLDKIFDRFYQGRGPVARRFGGAGLGLSLARDLAVLHGGTLTVASEPGLGSTFTVELPLGRGHFREDQLREGLPTPHEGLPPLVPVPPSEALHPSDGEGGDEDRTTVLVVEDHPGVRAYIRGHLAARYRVVEAADGAEGLARARELVPDLVVSDVMMPNLDGYALVRGLRQDPELDFIPVILLTARAGLDSKLEGLGDGADDYLTKPFDIRELRLRVDNLIASRQRLRERFRAERAPGNDLALPAVREPEATSADQEFLERVAKAIDEGLADETFDVESLAAQLAMGRTQLYRRLDALLGESPARLILERRLEHAARLLEARAGNVSEVAYAVGFKSVSHFCQRFRERHGLAPSAYRERTLN